MCIAGEGVGTENTKVTWACYQVSEPRFKVSIGEEVNRKQFRIEQVHRKKVIILKKTQPCVIRRQYREGS